MMEKRFCGCNNRIAIVKISHKSTGKLYNSSLKLNGNFYWAHSFIHFKASIFKFDQLWSMRIWNFRVCKVQICMLYVQCSDQPKLLQNFETPNITCFLVISYDCNVQCVFAKCNANSIDSKSLFDSDIATDIFCFESFIMLIVGWSQVHLMLNQFEALISLSCLASSFIS